MTEAQTNTAENNDVKAEKTPKKQKPQKQNRRNNNNNNRNKAPKHDHKTRLMIDASHVEETRVAVVKQGRLEDFEVESLVRKQIKGNIYLAKVTRVEPSLQAAFVNYGGNRHGFLPFSEIHPDYYRIPVADRERLMAEQVELERVAAEEAAKAAEEEDRKAAEEQEAESEVSEDGEDKPDIEEVEDEDSVLDAGAEAEKSDDKSTDSDDEDDDTESETSEDDNNKDQKGRRGRGKYNNRRGGRKYSSARNKQDRVSDDDDDEVSLVEPFWKRIRRAYKIQEVIKRGQIMLIQVGKEERGNKGAAVTSYITLPGRYCVLMPNTPQSGGVSRKISNFKDRKRMREILKDLNVPDGMSVILRTAGTTRTKVEIKRDLDYLMRLWNNARDLTLKSSAPALINEEGSLIKRAIRDIYNKDIDEVIVAGDDGYKAARDMMKMLMPSHVKKVEHYKAATPLFIAQKLEKQIEEMHSPQVELKSGGYLVINPTEALVSIDVNSGRATKERNIDDTALRTNIEAAEEIARQLKLRDLGGLVVIDFIDMERRSFNGKVERAMREALSGDRARIQIGRISSFGLMEMSRQRLHPSLTEAHFETCPHCMGMGIVKTVDTMALTIIRALEESGMEKKNADVTVTLSNDAAIYLFNNHRATIADIESRYNLSINIAVGKAEAECGFDIVSIKKPAVVIEDNDEVVEVEIAEDVAEEKIQDTQQPSSDEEKPKRKRNNSRRKNMKQDDDNAVAVEEAKTEPEVEVKVEEKPAPKKRGRPAKKKIVIEEVAEPAVEVDSKPAPTNDNDTDDDINQTAREAETVNQAPKKKKKGWWNKITS